MNKALYLLTCFFACQLFAMDNGQQSPTQEDVNALNLVCRLCEVAAVFSIAAQERDKKITAKEAAAQLKTLKEILKK